MVPSQPALANHIPFAPGDVFAGVGFGQVKHFAPDGTLLEILDTNTGSFVDTGMCFDAAGNLYTTNFGDDSVSTFNNTGLLLQAGYVTGLDASPESCLFDAAGNLYVGQAEGTHHLLKFDPTGNVLATFAPATEDRGTDWIELAADQCTLFYTSQGASIKRFDVCTRTQLPDFCGPCGPDQPEFRTYGLFSPRLHSDGSVLVVDQEIGAIRRFDGAGMQIQSYPVPVPDTYLVPPPGDGTPAAPFTLTLDPDGTSFWTGDVNTGQIFRVDIASGALLTQFDAGIILDLEGLAVFGELRVATRGDVSVLKTASLTSINAGDPAQFTIQVTALGPGASTNVVLTDTLPAGLSWTVGGADAAACSPASPVPGGTTLTCGFGTLAQGATKTISLTAATTTAVCPAINNTATVSATGDSNPSNNSSGPVTITVTCAPTVVTASVTAASKPYDATTAATITSCTLSGVLGTDDVSCTTSGATFATANAGNGKPVSATVSLTGAAASHYVLASTSATTTADVTPAPASVTPNAASKVYGTADPAFTGTLSGFLAADNVTATYSRTAGETVAGSPYTISATLSPAGVLGNYTITSNTASFTITKANASLTPNAASKVYGTADPAFTGTLSGFLAADNVTATYSRTAGETVAGSPYTISATLSPAGVLGNYIITSNTASFTITKATASVTPNAASKVYGTADPAFTGTLSGFLAADNVTATYSRTAGETVAGSPYTISATLSPAGALGNYTITYNTASFTITLATPVVTWANPADITNPTPLSGTQLNAMANVPGTFAYTPPAGTVLSPGTNQLLSVLFTPTDTSDYTTAPAQVHVNVLQASAQCAALPCQVPAKNPANVVTVTSCSAPAVTTFGNWTQINMPASDVVLKCALTQLPGTNGVRIIARSIKIDGADAAHQGSITTSGVLGIQLTASALSCNDATVEILSATLTDNNPNGDVTISACGDVVVSSSSITSAGQAVSVTATSGRICAEGNAFFGNDVSLQAQGDLMLRSSSVQTIGPRDNIKLVSTAGSVLAGGAGPAPCLPNQFKGGNESNMTVTASGIIDQTGACVDIAEDITLTASGTGRDCASDTIIALASAELRNDFAKTGFIKISACSNAGRIDIANAILVDAGAKGGGTDPNAVSSLNGGKVTTATCPAISPNPPNASCSSRPIDLGNHPVCADQTDRALHHVVGQPKVDR